MHIFFFFISWHGKTIQSNILTYRRLYIGVEKTYRKTLLVILIIFMVLTIFRLLWLAYFTPSNNQPLAQAGVLDMRQQTLTEDEIYQINGEWLYYPEVLLKTPNSNETSSSIEQTVRKIPMQRGSATKQHFGTYRVKILLSANAHSNHRYAIRVPAISTASALYINGKLAGQS
ncbi:Histidine kinase OS=Lysinibacillus sphaericus OX=1421 GN=LS41612_20990 PE=4 SV=1 [Lysinibacillus sphaericus]